MSVITRRLRKPIADPPDGLNELRSAGGFFNLGAKSIDVRIHRMLIGVGGVTPHGVKELFARKSSAWVGGHIQQEIKLSACEVDQVTVNPNLTATFINYHAQDLDWRFGYRLRGGLTSKEGLYSGNDLTDAEWFRDVIIGAELQSENFLNFIPSGGEHHDVRVHMVGS